MYAKSADTDMDPGTIEITDSYSGDETLQSSKQFKPDAI